MRNHVTYCWTTKLVTWNKCLFLTLMNAVGQEFENIAGMASLCCTVPESQRLSVGGSLTHMPADWATRAQSPGSTCAPTCRSSYMWPLHGMWTSHSVKWIAQEGVTIMSILREPGNLHGLLWLSYGVHRVPLLPYSTGRNNHRTA